MMMDWLVRTNGDIVPLILRLTLAAVIFPHGAQKTLGGSGDPACGAPWSISPSRGSRLPSGFSRSRPSSWAPRPGRRPVHARRAQLKIPLELTIICALAVGYTDPDFPTNKLRIGRDPVPKNVVFHDD